MAVPFEILTLMLGTQQKMKEFAQGATAQELLEYEGEVNQEAQNRTEDLHTA